MFSIIHAATGSKWLSIFMSFSGLAAASVDNDTGRRCAQVSWELMRGHLPALAAATAGGSQPEMGVFVGIQQMEYSGMAAPHLTAIGPYSATGGAFSVAAGRLSFTHGLKGKNRQQHPAALT